MWTAYRKITFNLIDPDGQLQMIYIVSHKNVNVINPGLQIQARM